MTYFSQMAAPPSGPIAIGFLGFDGFSPLDLTGPLEAFAAARRDAGAASCYQIVLVGVTGKTFTARSGATLKAKYTLETAPVFDTIIIPGGANLATSESSGLIATWLRAREHTTRRFASVATGIYPLAQSGLLDGRRVTTHWRHAQNVARAFRRLQVDDAASFIKDDRFYTSGGGTAGIEMSLALIREDYGSIAAMNVARELVMNLRPASEGERPDQSRGISTRHRRSPRGAARLDHEPAARESFRRSPRRTSLPLPASLHARFQTHLSEHACPLRRATPHQRSRTPPRLPTAQH